ncbi:MAG: hypothetical protein ACRBC3_04825 [Burkholderiaceae bacterium]
MTTGKVTTLILITLVWWAFGANSLEPTTQQPEGSEYAAASRQ